MKKPILGMGILLFGLFLYQVGKKEKWGIFANDRLQSHSCKAAVIKIDNKIPGNWKIFCEGNNMAVIIKETSVPEKATNIKTLMYRQLANHMSHVARVSHVDILQKVDFIRFQLIHPQMDINAVTEGKFIVKLATLETPEHIMTHLQSTVQVKETAK